MGSQCMVTEVRPLQLEKAEPLMDITFSVKVRLSTEDLPLNNDVTVSQSNVNSFMFEQLENASDAKDLGLHCMVTETRLLQSLKA